MSQDTILLPTTGQLSGLQMAQDINLAHGTLASCFSGPAAPSSPIANQFWADTTNYLLKQRNSANSAWVVRGALDLDYFGLLPASYFRPHAAATPNMTVLIEAGKIQNITSKVSQAAQTTATFTAPATNPRNDLVVIDSATAAYSIVAGTEAASPADPAIPSGKIAVGRVRLTVGMTSIPDASIDDIRPGFYIPPASSSVQIQTIPTPTFAAGAMTIPSSAFTLDFRSATLGSGAVTPITGSPAALVIPSGATLGTANATQSRLIVLILNNAGTLEYAVINEAGGIDLMETGVISTTAISAAASSANVVYSTTARTNVAYRMVGYFESTQGTAGTWATAPSTIQGIGGNVLLAMNSMKTPQNLSGSRAVATNYTNTSGVPRTVIAVLNGTSGGYAQATLTPPTGSAITIVGQVSNAAGSVGSFITFDVPHGWTYSITMSTGTPSISSWFEYL